MDNLTCFLRQQDMPKFAEEIEEKKPTAEEVKIYKKVRAYLDLREDALSIIKDSGLLQQYLDICDMD